MTEMLLNYQQLHMFTSLKLKMARRLAAAGEKDEARSIARYIRNARIVEILKPHSGELLIDAFLMESHLRDLEGECHPLSPALFETDKFSQVLTRLDLIAGLLNARAGAPSGQRTNSLRCNSGVQCLSRLSDSGLQSSRNLKPTLKASVQFSVCVARQPDSAANSGLRLAPKDSPRNFSVAQSSSDRDGERTKATTLRLRVAGHKLQAKKEKV